MVFRGLGSCGVSYLCVFFFFKSNAADVVRISDWSSDVFSSDLKFDADAFRDNASAVPPHVKYVDFWQREEYALFQGNGAQAEAIYSIVTAQQAALQYNDDRKSVVEEVRV